MGVVHGMEVAKAGETFSILSVGDALASQLPALLMSAASGIVVTRSEGSFRLLVEEGDANPRVNPEGKYTVEQRDRVPAVR